MNEPVKKKIRPVQLFFVESVHIDPLHCNSTISAKIVGQGTYLDATITMTDCGRKIDWEFDESEDSLSKVDATIIAFMNFKKALVKARKEYKNEKE